MALTCRLLAATGRSRARSRRRRTLRCASLPPLTEPDLRRSTFSVFLRLADALTRPQMSPYANNSHPVHLSSVFDPASLPQHPSSLFPTATSLARVLPPPADTALIIEHALESTGWHHACIHAPSFRAELAEFMTHPDEARFETASPAWLALLFAQLACGTKHMTREQLKQLGPFGLSDGASSSPPDRLEPAERKADPCTDHLCADDMRTLTKTHLDAALACLYRSHFLENHQLHAVQAITILVVGCQDVPQSNLFPMLLSTCVPSLSLSSSISAAHELEKLTLCARSQRHLPRARPRPAPPAVRGGVARLGRGPVARGSRQEPHRVRDAQEGLLGPDEPGLVLGASPLPRTLVEKVQEQD